MKNIFIGLLLTTCAFTAYGQEDTITIKTDDFHAVTALNDIKVYIVKSKENKVVINGHNTENVVVKNKKGELIVKMNTKNMFQGKSTTATVYYTGELSEIYASTDAEIESKDTFKQQKLEINSDAGGFIFLKVSLQDLKINVTSGGQIQTVGSTESQFVKVNAGGKYNGMDMDSNYAEVKVMAGGSANVFVTKNLKAAVSMGGRITYAGNPGVISQQISLGGEIIKK